MLKGKHILVGVTGGIAAYKTATIIRSLVKEGADVKVIIRKTETGTVMWIWVFGPIFF
jgi:phosphopantothenoylcysteine decarboxylase/phosphopantothenate--cysteine ligase